MHKYMCAFLYIYLLMNLLPLSMNIDDPCAQWLSYFTNTGAAKEY